MLEISDEDRKVLEANPLIKSVGENHVQFSHRFKTQALKLHSEGLRPSDVFRKLGVDPDIFRVDYPKKTISRWRKIVEAHGEKALMSERRGSGATGRPKKEKPKSEKALLARIATLEAQVDFLKKLRALGEKPESKKRSR